MSCLFTRGYVHGLPVSSTMNHPLYYNCKVFPTPSVSHPVSTMETELSHSRIRREHVQKNLTSLCNKKHGFLSIFAIFPHQNQAKATYPMTIQETPWRWQCMCSPTSDACGDRWWQRSRCPHWFLRYYQLQFANCKHHLVKLLIYLFKNGNPLFSNAFLNNQRMGNHLFSVPMASIAAIFPYHGPFPSYKL